MNLWNKFINNERLRRFVVLLFLIVLLYLARSLLSPILLTFIFTFLIIRLMNCIQKYVKISDGVIAISVYLLIIGVLYFAITMYVPKIISQSKIMIESLIDFYQNTPKNNDSYIGIIRQLINQFDVLKQLRGGALTIFSYISSVGSGGLTLVISMLLSFFFTFERKEVYRFSNSFLKGPNAWIFSDIYYFAKIFVNTFGIVLEAQFIIAFVNTVITTICLHFMNMPQLVSLALMIFILSLIPVAGVIISAIPMCLIAYSVGGIRDVIYIVVMLAIVHALEAYVLNPQLLSSKTELPIFYTFIILFVSEHLFGIWGLIVGIPIFTFALKVLDVQINEKHVKN